MTGKDDEHPEVPVGEYCYAWSDPAPGEVLETQDPARFGREQRIVEGWGGRKRTLCPHWQRTDYGTVRCSLLDYEVLRTDLDYFEHKARAIAHFGQASFDAHLMHNSEFEDEIKVCKFRLEDPDEETEND